MSPLLSGLLLLLPALQGPPAPQDDKVRLRTELSQLWAEQRYPELTRRVTPFLNESRDAADLWVMAAEAALKLEDFPRAIAYFETALRLAPALAPTTINLGFAYLKADRLEDARKVFERFRKDGNPGRAAKAAYGVALILLAHDDAAGAREALLDAARLDPDDARPRYRLGQLALEAGDCAAAIAAFTRTISIDEMHHGAAYGLARACGMCGRPDEGAAWKEKHLAILEADDAVAGMIRRLGEARDPVEARLAIARRLAAAGARANAGTWYRRVLRIDPANDEARQALQSGESRPDTRR